MVDKKTIEHVASISRINLTQQESEKLCTELSDILELFSVINEVNTDGIEPSFQPIEIKNVTREDVPEESLTQKKALKNAQQKEDGFFKGPRSV